MTRSTNHLLTKFDEPSLVFGHNQKTYDPRDGLTLFGPHSRGKINNINVGIIGTNVGIARLKRWLKKIIPPVKSIDNDIARPFFPGFESTFEASINLEGMPTIEIDPKEIDHFLNYKDGHQRVFNLVTLYSDALIKYKKEEESDVQVWFVVIPDQIYLYCRPKSRIAITDDTITVGISDRSSRAQPSFLPELEELRQPYYYEQHFHNQLKGRLLPSQIITQVVKESTIAYREIVNKKGEPKRDLSKFESAIAWNLSTALYYKAGGLPWKLGEVREGVCYIGLVYKKVDTDTDEKTACCAAQMFLDSGDGLVFRGNVGPWYNPKKSEYHLSRESAYELIDKALKTFEAKHNKRPDEIFVHAKTYFNDEEWQGFVEAANNKSKIVGVRIRDERVFKLYRDFAYPIPRSLAYVGYSENKCFLWTRGFVPRLQTMIGLETPNPISIRVCRGLVDIDVVAQDILALTKLNYNTCIYGDGNPVTLKFAEAVGEILTATPIKSDEVLPFKYYI